MSRLTCRACSPTLYRLVCVLNYTTLGAALRTVVSCIITSSAKSCKSRKDDHGGGGGLFKSAAAAAHSYGVVERVHPSHPSIDFIYGRQESPPDAQIRNWEHVDRHVIVGHIFHLAHIIFDCLVISTCQTDRKKTHTHTTQRRPERSHRYR